MNRKIDRVFGTLLFASTLHACGDALDGDYGVCWPSGDENSDPFVDCIEAFEPQGAEFGHADLPDVIYGPPKGSGDGAGSTDVASLGCGGTITVFFDDPIIVDGPGPDFIVFENPFVTGMTTFAEPARVSVSKDRQTWYEFPCFLDGMETWPPSGCAGISPVHANPMNDLDPTDADEAGGDAFDLADVGLDEARYIRLVDATAEYYGSVMWCGGSAGGFDLDGMAIVGEK